MTDVIRLEFAKQRLAFWGVAMSFAVSLPMAALGGWLGRVAASDALNGVALFWTLIGLPAAAVLLGAAAGGGLRSEPAAGADAPLPVSPRRRVGGALSAALLYLAVTAAFVLAFSLVVSPGWRSAFIEFSWAPPALLRSAIRSLAFVLLYLGLTSFTCAYVLRHGLAGGLVGAAFGGVTGACLVCGLALEIFFDHDDRMLFAPVWVPVAVIALAAGAAALSALAERLERGRRLGWALACIALLGVAAGPLLSVGSLGRVTRTMLTRPTLLEPDPLIPGSSSQEAGRRFLPGARRAEAGGLLADSLEGNLWWIAPDGRRTLLVSIMKQGLKDVLRFPFWRWVHSTLWDDDGTLWVLVEKRPDMDPHHPLFEIYHGAPEGRLRLHSTLTSDQMNAQTEHGSESLYPRQFMRRGRQVGLLFWGTESNRFAPIPKPGQRLALERVTTTNEDFLMAGVVKEGWAACAEDGRLKQGPCQPGKRTRRIMGVTAGGKKLFLEPDFVEGRGSALRVHDPSGAVRKVWESPEWHAYDLSVTLGGDYWGWRGGTVIHLLTRDGVFLPPVDFGPALAKLPARRRLGPIPSVLRLEAGKVWLTDGAVLSRMDAGTGAIEETWRLPDSFRGAKAARWRASEKGFFLDTGRSLYFIGWDGARRKVG